MLIQDIKPYPSRLQALSQAFLGELVSLRGKRINVRYIKPVELRTATMFPDLRAFTYQPTEDDYIQDRAQEVFDGAREYEAEMLRGLDQ
jgi:hypothetical protein